MAQDMPRPSIGTPPVGLVAGGLIAAACGLWLAATTISRVSPPAEEPRAAAGRTGPDTARGTAAGRRL